MLSPRFKIQNLGDNISMFQAGFVAPNKGETESIWRHVSVKLMKSTFSWTQHRILYIYEQSQLTFFSWFNHGLCGHGRWSFCFVATWITEANNQANNHKLEKVWWWIHLLWEYNVWDYNLIGKCKVEEVLRYFTQVKVVVMCSWNYVVKL